MKRRVATIMTLVAGTWMIPTSADADTLAYIRASSQLAKKDDPSTYHPINLLDDDPATIWCEGAAGYGEAEEVRIYFKQPQKIDRLVVGPATGSGRLIRTVRISDGSSTAVVHLDNQYVEQAVNPPMKGTKFTIEIAKVGEANAGSKLGDDVACLADVMMYFRNAAFGGKATPASLRYDKLRDRILGFWNGDPLGAPEKFITFAMDGTWSWYSEPILGGKRMRGSGEYRFRAGRLLMRKGETGRWADVRFKYRMIEVDPTEMGAPKGDYEVISFESDALGETAGEYNNAEF